MNLNYLELANKSLLLQKIVSTCLNLTRTTGMPFITTIELAQNLQQETATYNSSASTVAQLEKYSSSICANLNSKTTYLRNIPAALVLPHPGQTRESIAILQ